MAKLVIVESPAKAKTIGKYLGDDYEVTASMGHIRDLPASQLGIDVEHGYTPQYISIKGKEKLIKELKSKAKHADGVLLATDPDREGEAISWHLANILGLDPHAPNRVTFDEITKKGVKEGMAHPRAIDEDLFNAQQARRVLDRLVGYKLSPFLWRKVRRGLSAGRVQSVAVRLIDDREKEIESFKPDEYWNVDVTLGAGHKSFTARLATDSKGKKLLPKNEAEARAIEKGLEGAEYVVAELKKGKRAKQPTPAFITSTLQQEASRRLGFTATRTMRAAQTLYEGVDIAGHGTMGLITYMRTDSLRISDEAVAAAKEYIAGAYGENYICPYKRVWKTKSATAAQDAHEAIRPSVPSLTPDEVDKSISGDTAKLYRMIWSRFMASQMADCQQDTVSVITTIIDRGYVERDQKKLKPTLLGRAVDGLMLEQFPHIVDVDFSAQMEKNLDKVESGKADWRKTVDDFYQGFEASLEQAEKNMEGKKVKVPDEPSSEVCDLCGRPMVIKVGKYGKFLACSGFPECRGTKRLVKDTGGICPKCGKGRMLERKSAKGRIYYGCERYPDCDFMTWDMPVATKCEKCGSTLFRKGSKLYCAKEGCGFEMPVPKKD